MMNRNKKGQLPKGSYPIFFIQMCYNAKMAKQKTKLFIGTSGWVYPHWKKIFYSEDLDSKDKLKYFSQHFETTEINYSFYRLPTKQNFQKWRQETPNDFVFAVKASRYITHIKRLKEVEGAYKTFLERAQGLEKKLGPILFQFPPNFQATDENIQRLLNFLPIIKTDGLRNAFEFRHQTWFDERIYKILKKYNIALVIADSPNFPKTETITADFVYIRMHGSKILFTSKYTDKELKDLFRKIAEYIKQNLDVYVYFNNDTSGFAIANAKTLIKFCK